MHAASQSMAQSHLSSEILVIFIAATVVTTVHSIDNGQSYDPEKNRDLADIRYKFSSCGTTGRSGPTFSTCQMFYGSINSPIAQQNLLFEFENREYEGAQGFRVPKNGVYNITVAGAGGGRGICNSEYGGRGFQRIVQVELSTDFELLILVGQRGTGSCDVIPETEEAYDLFCREPPATSTDAIACNETWYNFTRDFDRSFYEAFGGGAGGGGSLVRARRKDIKTFDIFPIVIVGGGGGSASLLDYDTVEQTSAITALPAKVLSYRIYVNGKSRRSHTGATFSEIGVRGTRKSSSNSVAGAGGGYSSIFQSINIDGRALSSSQNFAEGGLDCTESFIAAGHHVPYSGVYGGFGGGGGACGGGGGGGGYTGGAVLDAGLDIPGGGGYSYVGDDFGTSFSVHEVDNGRLSEGRDDGFVEIILANCGCVHRCLVNSSEDTFKCLCPKDTLLAPDLSDCYANTTMPVNEGSLISIGSELYYKFMEFENTIFILSNNMYIQSNNEMCVLFWLGEDLQIVLSTNVVRGSGRIDTLAVVDDDVTSSPTLSTMLTSSVLVTGALLVGTGDCTVFGSSMSVNASIQNPHRANVSTEDFFNGNISAVEQRAAELAMLFFLEQATVPVLYGGSRTTPDAVVIVSSTVVAGTILLFIIIVIFAVIGRFIVNRCRSKRVLNDEVPGTPTSAARYKDCLVLNLSYSKIDVECVPSPKHQPDNPYYHEIPPLILADEGEISSSTEIELTPVHGVTCPQHDFTSFNRKRRNTLIKDAGWDYPRGNLIYMRELGEGEFGKVHLMKAKNIAGYSGHIPVAVKTLTSRDPEVIKKFHEEANLMIKFSHPNIVSLLGFIQEEKDEDSAPLMVLEFMQYGDLASFMKSHRPVGGQSSVIGEAKFLAFAIDVAKGLEFLSSMKYVHRDLAARNCLVGAGLRIKIADFGLARAVHNKDYYKVGGVAVLPVRWMAPESLLFGVFSSASDVWSYGVLLWEIVSYGRTPLRDTSVEDIVNAAQNQVLCHTRPPNCPDCLYDLMSGCLEQNSEKRLEASDIVAYLDGLNNEFETEEDTCTDSEDTASPTDEV